MNAHIMARGNVMNVNAIIVYPININMKIIMRNCELY